MSIAAYTAFDGQQRLASGSLSTVALAVKRRTQGHHCGSVLNFDDRTGRSIDVDLSLTDQEMAARLSSPTSTVDSSEAANDDVPDAPRGRGRPKLGVVAREVTLLPRH